MNNIDNYYSLSSKRDKESYYKTLSKDDKLSLYFNVSSNNDKMDILSFCSIDDLINIFKNCRFDNKQGEMRYFLTHLHKSELSSLYKALDSNNKVSFSEFINDMQLDLEERSNDLLQNNNDLTVNIGIENGNISTSEDRIISNREEIVNLRERGRIVNSQLKNDKRIVKKEIKVLNKDKKRKYKEYLQAKKKFNKKSIFKFVNKRRLEKYKEKKILYNESVSQYNDKVKEYNNIITNIDKNKVDTANRINELNKEIVDLKNSIKASEENIKNYKEQRETVLVQLRNVSVLISKISKNEKRMFGKKEYFNRERKRLVILEQKKESASLKQLEDVERLKQIVAEVEQKLDEDSKKNSSVDNSKKDELKELYEFVNSLNMSGIQIPNFGFNINEEQFIEKFDDTNKKLSEEEINTLKSIKEFKIVKEKYDERKANGEKVIRFETRRKNKEGKLVGRFGKLYDMLHSLNSLGIIVPSDIFVNEEQFINNFEQMIDLSSGREIELQTGLDVTAAFNQMTDIMQQEKIVSTRRAGYVNYFYFMLVASVLVVLFMLASILIK